MSSKNIECVRKYLDMVAEDAAYRRYLFPKHPDGSLCRARYKCPITGLRANIKGNSIVKETSEVSRGKKSSSSANRITLNDDASLAKNSEHVKQAKAALKKILEDFGKRGFTIEYAVRKLAKVLHAKPDKARSRYRTYQRDDGTVFTLRLSDHSAHPQSYKRHSVNADFNISLVVQGSGDTKLRGEAPGIEISQFTYFYKDFTNGDDVKLLVKSLLGLFENGQYVDLTGKASIDRQTVSESDVQDFLNEEYYDR